MSVEGAEAVATAPEVPGYDLLRTIGRGAQGTVWLARARDGLGREVAVKLFAPDGLGGFAREIETWRRIEAIRGRHARGRLAEGIAADTVPDGGAFIAMAHYPLGSVAALLRARGPLPEPLAVRFIEQAAEGVELLHAHGIVHRDIKPSNLLLRAEDEVCLADFGLARSEDGSFSAAGTPGFCAPEFYSGAPPAPGRGPAADVYSLSATLHAMLVGFAPRPGMADLFALERAQVSRPVQAAIARGLALDPGARTPTVQAFRAELAAAVRGGAFRAERRPRFPSRRASRSALGATLAALFIAVLLRGTLADDAPRDPATTAEGIVRQLVWDGEGRKVVRCSVLLDRPAALVGAAAAETALSWLGSVPADLRTEGRGERRVISWTRGIGARVNRGSVTIAPRAGGRTLLVLSVEAKVSPYPAFLANNLLLWQARRTVAEIGERAVAGHAQTAAPAREPEARAARLPAEAPPSPAGRAVPSQQALAALALGWFAYQSGDPDRAARQAGEAIAAAPDLAEAYALRGATRYERDDFAGARPDLERAVALESSIVDPYYLLASVYTKQGEPRRAIPLLEDVLGEYPGHSEALLALAEARAGLAEWPAALDAAERALAAMPDDPRASRLRAHAAAKVAAAPTAPAARAP